MELCFCGFFFKIMFLTACLTIAVAGARSQEQPMRYNENNDENEQCNCKLTDEIYQKMQEVIETILDKKLEKIVNSQNSLITTKKDTESSLHNLHQKMDHITDHVIPELSTHIFNRISSKMDSAHKENLILLESKINLEVDNSMTKIQNNLTSKLDSINGLYKNSTTTILLEQTINITTISRQLVELKNKLEMFERNTNESEHKILLATNTQYLNEKVNSVYESIRELKLNIIEEIQTSEAKLSQQIDVFKKNEIESSNYKKNLLLIEKITTQQINNITFQISDICAYIFKYERTLNSIGEINQKLSVLDRFHSLEQRAQDLFRIDMETQKSVAKVDQKLDILARKLNQQLDYLEKNEFESNKYRKSQKSIEIATTEQINNITFQISEIRLYISKHEIMLKPIEEIKRKVTVLERFLSLEQHIQYLLNVYNNMQTSVANLSSTYKQTQKSIEKMTAEQMNTITTQISDIRTDISKNENTLKSIEEIKQKVTVLDRFQSLEQHIQYLLNVYNNMQTSVANLSSTYKQTQKSIEKMTAEQMNTITTQISDIRTDISKNENTLKSIEEIKQKVTVLDRFQSLEQHIQYIWNVTKPTQTSEAKTNQESKITNEIKETNESNTNGDRETELQTSQNLTKATSCAVRVPASIVTKHDIWNYYKMPEKDDLDTYMINKTGCSYAAVSRYQYQEPHHAAVPFTGQLEWRVAVRAMDAVGMRLMWGSRLRFSFYVGERKNTESGFNDWEHDYYPARSTPGLLAEDRYVPIYMKINNGKLTAGVECEPEPWFTANFTAEKGQQLEKVVRPYSPYGVKYLYDCPASFTCISTLDHLLQPETV